MAADIPFMEVTGRKVVQNGGRSILKMTTGFGLFSSLSKVKIYFFLLFTLNLSYFNCFKLPYKIRLPGFRSPLTIFKQKCESCTDLSFRFLISSSKRWFLRIINSNERKVTTDLIHYIPHDGVDIIMNVKISNEIFRGADIRKQFSETQQVVILSLCEL